MPNQEYQANVKKILKIKKPTNSTKLNLWYLFLKMVYKRYNKNKKEVMDIFKIKYLKNTSTVKCAPLLDIEVKYFRNIVSLL